MYIWVNPEIPENTRHTRKYPKVKKIPGNTRSYFSTLLPDPNPTRYPVFCTIPDPTRYWKTLPAGHWHRVAYINDIISVIFKARSHQYTINEIEKLTWKIAYLFSLFAGNDILGQTIAVEWAFVKGPRKQRKSRHWSFPCIFELHNLTPQVTSFATRICCIIMVADCLTLFIEVFCLRRFN